MAPPAVPSVEPTELPIGAKLIDVREPDEWQAGHIDGALHIPLGDLPDRLGDVPDQQLVMVCRSGQRSGRAVAWLAGNGYQAVNLAGGMQAWAAAGLPMVTENGDPPTVR